MTGGEIQFTASVKRKRTSYEMFVNWVSDVQQQVATDNAILKGFKECGYIGYDGDVNSLHSRLRDTIVNREIPPEVLAKVNEFLIQLEAEHNETGGNLDESFFLEQTTDMQRLFSFFTQSFLIKSQCASLRVVCFD